MNKTHFLLLTGVIFIITAPAFYFIVVPSWKKLPEDFNQILYFYGTLGVLNATSAEMEYTNVMITRHAQVIETQDNSLTIKEDITLRNNDTKEELKEYGSSKTFIINPYTSKNIGVYERKGLFSFPIGVEKKDYLMWNSDLDDACKKGYITPDEAVYSLHYLEEETIYGVKTYKFKGQHKDIFFGYLSDPPNVKVYYSCDQTVWAEVQTGAIVDKHLHWQRHAVFPDLYVLPEDLQINIKMTGDLWILTRGKKRIETTRNISVENVYQRNGKKVLTLKTETTTYDATTGKKIDVACSQERHDVFAKTGEKVRNNIERKAIFIFPPGIEEKDYSIWNTEINAPSLAEFVKTEDYKGIKTYVFEINEDRTIYDTTPGIERNIRYVTTTKYWVEPTTGRVVDMEMKSKKKINILHTTFGIRGLLWFDIYRLSLSFDDATVSANIQQAIQDKKQIQSFSEKKVLIAELNYQMSRESRQESIKEWGETGFFLLCMQCILPLIFLAIGVPLVFLSVKKSIT